jgi:glycosyltransferase involved in cell wall biosynthesis
VLEEAVAHRGSAFSLAPTVRRRVEPYRKTRENVLVAHPGTQYSTHLATQIERVGRLAEFHTEFAVASENQLTIGAGWLPGRLYAALQNRTARGVPSGKIHNHGLGSLIDLTRLVGLHPANEISLHERNEKFQRKIPEDSLARAEVVVGFDTSSWFLAQRVKNLRRKFVLDQSIGHPLVKERVFESIRERFPAWSASIEKKQASHIREEILEHQLADVIVTPSRFVQATLMSEGVIEHKIRVIPFGTDLDVFRPSASERMAGPTIFLFVGSISARKGVPVLLEAWLASGLGNAELWLVGPGDIPEGVTKADSVRLLGRKSRLEVAELMRQADAFIFPSFFEGLAQVQIEALASGLPVIGTIESGCEEIVTDGVNGFVVKAGDVAAIAELIRRMADDPSLVGFMRKVAIKDREKLSWTHYGDRWGRLLEELS